MLPTISEIGRETKLWTIGCQKQKSQVNSYVWVEVGSRCSTHIGGRVRKRDAAWYRCASYPCGNFSDTSSWIFLRPKGSIGHVFTVCIRTENQNQASFSPFGPHEISVLIELTLGHLRYHLTDVPPQPNSLPDYVFRTDQLSKQTNLIPKLTVTQDSVQRNK